MTIDHFQEDGRCGYCYEEWPCAGSQGRARSGIHGWQANEIDKQYEHKRRVADLEEIRINELFKRLGYVFMSYPRHSATMTLTRTALLELLERIYENEYGSTTTEVGRRSDVPGRRP